MYCCYLQYQLSLFGVAVCIDVLTVNTGCVRRAYDPLYYYAILILWKKTKVMRISRQPPPMKIMIDQNNWRMWNISII